MKLTHEAEGIEAGAIVWHGLVVPTYCRHTTQIAKEVEVEVERERNLRRWELYSTDLLYPRTADLLYNGNTGVGGGEVEQNHGSSRGGDRSRSILSAGANAWHGLVVPVYCRHTIQIARLV